MNMLTMFRSELDRQNIITIDVHLDVTPDSMLLLQAASEVVEEEGFGQLLQDVRDRIDVIEGLHRTRELTVRLFHCCITKFLIIL